MVAKVQVNGRYFIWDDQKAALNIEKHGIDFRDAVAAFSDDAGVVMDDPLHYSQLEKRCVCLGFDTRGRLLRISFCCRQNGEVVRIISARKASRSNCSWYAGSRRWRI